MRTATDITEEAARLMNAANDAIGRADPNKIGGAVNWGDCGVIDVEVSALDLNMPMTVVIAEASPDASELHAFVRDELKRAGFDADVRTEW